MADCNLCKYDKVKEDYEHCPKCENGSEFVVITNADRIRSMTDEELAEFLYGIATSHECNICEMKQGWDCGKRDDENCTDGVRKWLQSDSEV